MTKQQISETIQRVLGLGKDGIRVGHDETRITCSVNVNYDNLLELSQALGTTKINFCYHEGSPGYSTWTPGTDAEFDFTIGIGAEA